VCFRADLGYDKLDFYRTKDSLIHIVCGRAYLGESSKLTYITIDADLNPIKPKSLNLNRGTDEFSLTDSRIDHQLFWLKPSSDLNYVGSINRYVFIDGTIYHSESDLIYARGRVEVEEVRKSIRDNIQKKLESAE
jgi:hypothetical protein